LPLPLDRGVGQFARQGIWKVNRTEAPRKILFLNSADFFEVGRQFRHQQFQQHRDAILVALPFANRDLAAFEVEILDAEAEPFEQPESGSVKKLADE
jgi:hypothetical protein